MANKKGVSAVEAGIVGAVVGAAVGATAVVLSDEKNRKKIGKKLNEYKKDGQKIYSDLKGKVEEMTSAGEAKVEEAKKTLKSKL
jgi:gas vesicle protein